MKKQNQKNHDAGASLHWLIGLNTLLPSCVNKVKVKVTQLCLTLCNPMDCNHGILQDRILEWVPFPFSRVSSQPRIKTRSPSLQADSLLTCVVSDNFPRSQFTHLYNGDVNLLSQNLLSRLQITYMEYIPKFLAYYYFSFYYHLYQCRY